MNGFDYEADREDPLEAFEDDLFGSEADRERERAVLIVVIGCALGAIALVLWR